jgi:CDP-paratose 2-epimerase
MSLASSPLAASSPAAPAGPYVLITGGAGFVGTNLAKRLLAEGQRVLLFDNLSRPGVARNLDWLRAQYPGQFEVQVGDVRDLGALHQAVAGATAVFHFAAQVAVTTSLTAPAEDFDINARGTLHVLEAIRAQPVPPPLVFTSTNKVYGGLEDLRFVPSGSRYAPTDAHIAAHGIGEQRPLDFHSPYGCSKGAADQYVLDYARSYGLPTVVFRMSCIYGPHQYGTEDQGWVAHFAIRALENQPISIYGDGKQVRDILFVEDLVDAFQLALAHMPQLAGQAFNIGGGVPNTVSLLELLDLMGQYRGAAVPLSFGAWRVGDQHYYVSDTTKFSQATGWAPRHSVREGVAKLYAWLCESRGLPVPANLGAAKPSDKDASKPSKSAKKVVIA